LRRLALGTGVALVYGLAAWSTQPGFYEGGFNPNPYRWLSPPPEFKPTNMAPEKGTGSFRIGRNGTVDPGSAFTLDGQASLSFVPGSFAPPPPGEAVTVNLAPIENPPVGQLQLAGNVYLISASKPLLKEALVTLTYSSSIPAPDRVYYREDLTAGDWQAIPTNPNPALFSLSIRTQQLGYFVAAYSPGAFKKPGGPVLGGGQTLPITVAVLILLVILGGIPLALLRRRKSQLQPGEGEDQATP